MRRLAQAPTPQETSVAFSAPPGPRAEDQTIAAARRLLEDGDPARAVALLDSVHPHQPVVPVRAAAARAGRARAAPARGAPVNCPGCGAPAPPTGSRCPACGAAPPPVTEGALAPDPARAEPLREIPGLRKRERTWKDEVRERVRERRKFRGAPGELPLFKGIDDEDASGRTTPRGRFPRLRTASVPSEPGIHALDDDDLPLRPRDDLHPAITFETPRPSARAA